MTNVRRGRNGLSQDLKKLRAGWVAANATLKVGLHRIHKVYWHRNGVLSFGEWQMRDAIHGIFWGLSIKNANLQ